MTIKKYGTKELERDYGALTFGEALESYRLGEGLSQKTFAQKLGISQSSLCDLEKGRRIPSAGRASAVAKKIKEPVAFWVQLAIQDSLQEQDIKLKVHVA